MTFYFFLSPIADKKSFITLALAVKKHIIVWNAFVKNLKSKCFLKIKKLHYTFPKLPLLPQRKND